MAPPELVRLTIVPNEPEAQLLQGLLAAEGIQSMYRQMDFSAGAWDGWAVAGAREILVYEGDLERARELIDLPPQGVESASADSAPRENP